MNKIKVGIIGVGNCFSGLVQGIEMYRTILKDKEFIGILHNAIGNYTIFDIDFVSAWDVGANKIDVLLLEAIYKEPNKVKWIEDNEERSEWWKKNDTIVKEAPVLDGIGLYVQNSVIPKENPTPIEILKKEITKEIQEKQLDVLVNYLPVGSQKATEFWANMALETNTALVNCIPVFIASNTEWEQKFQKKKIPIIGDDIKGQIGATIVHRILTNLITQRGSKLEKTYQLNVGGNTDFLNMLEQARLESKKISKTNSVQSQLKKELNTENIHIGPSDFIPFLGNTKIAFIRLEGKMFAEIPYNIELRLEVDDKANSAGVVIDAIRVAKFAKDRNDGGSITSASAYFMKHPIKQYTDDEAKALLEKYIEQ